GNAGSDSISVIDTTSDAVTSTIAIPETAGHGPRALAIAPTGAGERLLAAMFFAELRPGHNGLDEGQDDSREGRVAVFDAGRVALAPQADTGFLSNGSVLDHTGTLLGTGGVDAPDPQNPPVNTFHTGCFPNQLAQVAVQPGSNRAYVVSTGASPNGPFGFNVN